MCDCRRCGLPVQEGRAALGYTICRVCSEVTNPRPIRTVVPLHKSNYMLVSNRAELTGLGRNPG